MMRTSIGATLLLCLVCKVAEAQSTPRMFTGAAVGVATLSADARSEITAGVADVSLYKPENGPALNVFVGSHFHEYLTVQGNYVWNRNDVTLTSVRTTDSAPSFYDAPRASSQHAFIGDLLLYFRERQSAIRPYLSAGVGVVRFQTTARGGDSVRNTTLPPATSVATHALLRVAVGLRLSTSR